MLRLKIAVALDGCLLTLALSAEHGAALSQPDFPQRVLATLTQFTAAAID